MREALQGVLFSENYSHLVLILELREHARAKGARDSGWQFITPMKTTPMSRVSVTAIFLVLLAPLSAQLSKEMQDGLTLRSDAVAAVVKGSEQSAAAITRLKAHGSPSGLKIDKDADFAFAAIDVGQRLLVTGKSAEAEEFFREAEKSLEQAVKKTPDSSAREKAQYLNKLSFVRAYYLNKVSQARLDLDQAIALQPDDQKLRRTKVQLPSDPAEMLKKNSKG